MCYFLEGTTQELEIEMDRVMVIKHQLLGRHIRLQLIFAIIIPFYS